MPGEARSARRILLLAGTGEARSIAARLRDDPRVAPIISHAGRTSGPRTGGGVTERCGGFGGSSGLAAYLSDAAIALVIDATHPFAAVISPNALAACRRAGVPYLRVERPPWRPAPGDRWTCVPDLAAAARALAPGARVLLAVGGGSLSAFLARTDLHLVARMIEPPRAALPAHVTVVLGRGPFALADERRLIETHGIGAVVSKNAGGDATAAKLVAARERKLPVIMVERPAGQPVPDAMDVDSLMALVAPHLAAVF